MPREHPNKMGSTPGFAFEVIRAMCVYVGKARCCRCNHHFPTHVKHWDVALGKSVAMRNIFFESAALLIGILKANTEFTFLETSKHLKGIVYKLDYFHIHFHPESHISGTLTLVSEKHF